MGVRTAHPLLQVARFVRLCQNQHGSDHWRGSRLPFLSLAKRISIGRYQAHGNKYEQVEQVLITNHVLKFQLNINYINYISLILAISEFVEQLLQLLWLFRSSARADACLSSQSWRFSSSRVQEAGRAFSVFSEDVRENPMDEVW